MRLKSIKLSGFKSFVDPTTVPFQSNMTAVVGPNGCGKSNIIDAVRWVMGESSAKHLRGEAMADVIFNGSVSRKPVSRAAIELVFENTEGRVVSEYAKFTEISVKREVTRDGQSKYTLNGTNCRRRDVTDLFLGTGLGPRSYAIIEQGMIARIIEAKPEELRTYVEEAAGVSKYKERRRETENRIVRTRENLERLNDLADELSRQLDKLERQARAAERFKELKQQSRLVESLALTYQLKVKCEQSEDQKKNNREIALKIDELESQLSSNERVKIESQVQRDVANAELDRANTTFYANAARLSRLEATKEAHDEQVKQISHSRKKASQDLESLKQMTQSDGLEGTKAKRERDRLTPDLKKIEEDLLNIEKKIKAHETQMHFQEKTQSQLAGQLEEINSSITRCVTERQALQRQQQTDANRLPEIDQALSSLQDTDPKSVEKLQALVSQMEIQAMHSRIQFEQIENSELSLRDQLMMLKEKNKQAQEDVHDCEAEISRIKRIIDAESKSDDADIELWVRSESQILGRAYEFLEIDASDKEFFERAFPQWISGFIVDDLASIELDLVPPNTRLITKARIEQLPDELQKTDQPFDGAEHGYTSDGFKYGPGWIERVSDYGSGILRVVEKLPICEDELRKSEAVLQQSAQKLADKQTELDTVLAEVKTTRETLRHNESELVKKKNKLLGVQAKASEVELSRQRLDKERSLMIEATHDLTSEVNRLKQELSKLTITKNTLGNQLSPLDQSIAQIKLALGRLRDDRDRLINNRSDLRVQIERLDGICQRSELQIKRTEVQINQLLAEKRNFETDALSIIKRPAITADDLQNAVTESQQLEKKLRSARSAVVRCDDRLREIESKRLGLESERLLLNDQLSEAKLEAQAVEIEVKRIESELSTRNTSVSEIERLTEKYSTLAAAQNQLDQLYGRIERIGPVNLVALDEYQRELERKAELDHQYAELIEALNTLEDAIRKIDRETRVLFKQTFDSMNVSFGKLFPKLFGGGEAWLNLTDDDLLSTGVTIMARPPGKRNSSIYLLSGGEKALTALSLVFAIFQLNPSPFCLLDEVDAPLDDANVGRYADAVANMSDQVQFIFITHNKIAMERAKQLMGVTMSEPGVSRLVSVDIDRAVELAAE